jgi:hypothetical protein
LPRVDYEAVINIARQRNIFLLSDEMYRLLEVDNGSTLPAGCELYDQAFSLSGLSKTFGLSQQTLSLKAHEPGIRSTITIHSYYSHGSEKIKCYQRSKSCSESSKNNAWNPKILLNWKN